MHYQHPRRFPKNAPGAFYTVGSTALNGEWCGDCMACGAPEAEAPELLAPLKEDNRDTYFVRQPESTEEIEHACFAIQVCCVDALRYSGTDPAIIRRLGNKSEHSDYILIGGRLVLVGDLGRLVWWQKAFYWAKSWWQRRAE